MLARMFICFLAIAVTVPGVARAEGALSKPIARTLQSYSVENHSADTVVIRQHGRTMSMRRNAVGATLREVQWPHYLSVEIEYSDGSVEHRLLLGEEGWRDGVPAPAPLVAAMRLQAARVSLPMLLVWDAGKIRDLGGAVREDGVSVRRIAVEIGEGLTTFVEIDVETATILRSAGVMSFGGAEMSFGAAYTALTNFGPMRQTAREDLTAVGQQTGWMEIDSVELDRPVNPDSLRP